jgi:peptide deformylase
MLAGGVLVALRQIITFDNEFLHKKSRPVDKVDQRIKQLLDDMAETMYNTPNGGGLAACQVGILRRLVVADIGEGLLKLVNPEIIQTEGEQTVIEGCLSFPDIWGRVNRPLKVVVKALDEFGQPVIIEAADVLAKCLSHEIDHLDGIIFTDKVIEYVSIK